MEVTGSNDALFWRFYNMLNEFITAQTAFDSLVCGSLAKTSGAKKIQIKVFVHRKLWSIPGLFISWFLCEFVKLAWKLKYFIFQHNLCQLLKIWTSCYKHLADAYTESAFFRNFLNKDTRKLTNFLLTNFLFLFNAVSRINFI